MNRLLIAMILVFACASPALFAAPTDLIQAIESMPTLHTGLCNVESMGIENKQCCIHANPAKANSGWIILYNDKGKPEMILFVEDRKEKILWSAGSV